MDYTLEIQTIPGIADAEYLDRLAGVVYDIPGLIDPLLALNDDGSIAATFCVVGPDPLQAAHQAVEAFVQAVDAAEPLRTPSGAELAHGNATVGRFTVARADDRETVYA